MPDGPSESVASLDSFLSFEYCARRLPTEELDFYQDTELVAGWEFTFSGIVQPAVRFLIFSDFPYSMAKTAVWPQPRHLTWPHVDMKGILCVWDSHVLFDPREPLAVSKCLIEDTRRLFKGIVSGEDLVDFKKELNSYWNLGLNLSIRFYSTCEPTPVSRKIVYAKVGNLTVFAENPTELANCISNLGVAEPPDPRPTALFHVVDTPMPDEFPTTIGELRRLLPPNAYNSALLRSLLPTNGEGQTPILLLVDTPRGPTVVGLNIQSVRGSVVSVQRLRKGFRYVEKIPHQFFFARVTPVRAERIRVHRMDRSWVFGRDKNVDELTLRKKKIVLVGVGSIGSSVAKLLALAGVGRLALVDSDVLLPENISRHELGLGFVGENKAAAAATVLRRNIPICDIRGFPLDWHAFKATHSEEIAGADLVLDLTANWSVTCSISDFLAQSRSRSHLIVGWTEPFATAGRAVTMGPSEPLAEYFSNTGADLMPATSWPEGVGDALVPSCGGAFSPYGAMDISFVNSMIAQDAIQVLLSGLTRYRQSYWLTEEQRLLELSGSWNQNLVARIGPITPGARIARY